MTNERYTESRNSKEGRYAGKRYGRHQRTPAHQKFGVVSFPKKAPYERYPRDGIPF